MNIIVSLVLALLVVVTISLQKTYAAVPLKELKRRARKQDQLSELLYRAASYGSSLRALLWGIISILSASLFVAVSHWFAWWLALVICLAVIWVGFVWLPTSRVTKLGSQLAARSAPVISWVLNYLHPVFDRLVMFIRKHHPVSVHTGLYDTHDLIELINTQQVQTDNRIDKSGLDIAKHALTFGEQLVRDHLTPKRIVTSVGLSDDIGPLLMDELHKSGHSRFPVYDGKAPNIVGVLFMKDLVGTKHSGNVKDIMRPGVLYVHEEQSLYEALQAILKTRHQLFVVVNSFEEYVGIITIEDVLEQIIGKPILDEFDQYDDLRAVAARAASKEHHHHTQHTGSQTETKTSEKAA